jgi:hypothetical protein
VFILKNGKLDWKPATCKKRTCDFCGPRAWTQHTAAVLDFGGALYRAEVPDGLDWDAWRKRLSRIAGSAYLRIPHDGFSVVITNVDNDLIIVDLGALLVDEFEQWRTAKGNLSASAKWRRPQRGPKSDVDDGAVSKRVGKVAKEVLTPFTGRQLDAADEALVRQLLGKPARRKQGGAS